MITYEYADGDRLEDRNTYFYTPYHGRAFLDAWRRSRSDLRRRLPASAAPPAPAGRHRLPDVGSQIDTGSLLEALYSAGSWDGSIDGPTLQWVDRLVKKFELGKRLYDRYRGAMKADLDSSYRNLAHYVRLAEILLHVYNRTGILVYLNTLLKLVDSLASVSPSLSPGEAARLAWLIDGERTAIETLSRKRSGGA